MWLVNKNQFSNSARSFGLFVCFLLNSIHMQGSWQRAILLYSISKPMTRKFQISGQKNVHLPLRELFFWRPYPCVGPVWHSRMVKAFASEQGYHSCSMRPKMNLGSKKKCFEYEVWTYNSKGVILPCTGLNLWFKCKSLMKVFSIQEWIYNSTPVCHFNLFRWTFTSGQYQLLQTKRTTHNVSIFVFWVEN